MLLLEALNHTQGFSDGHSAIAAWLVEHRNEAHAMTTKQIARATFTSPAAVVRLAQKLGYEGFDDLRRELARESVYLNQNFRGVDANQPLSAGDSMMTVAAKVSALARETAADTLSLMDEATLARAVELMERARAIHVAAVSFPLLYAQDFQLKMRRIGKPVLAVTIPGEQLFAEQLATPEDCALVVSYSGTTPATLDLARMYQRCGVPIIAVTSMGTNPLRELADITLTLTTRERLYSKVAGFTSEVSIKLTLDTLYACYFSRHLNENQHMKDEVSSHAEPGRTSDSAILREEDDAEKSAPA